MNLFKNYKFYIILASLICIFVVKISTFVGVSADIEFITNIASYILSGLIAYNVITINTPKSDEDIKSDLNNSINDLQKAENKQMEDKNNTSKTNIKTDTTH